MSTREQQKDEIVWSLLEKRISAKQAIALLMDLLKWSEEDATDYVNWLLEG